MVPDYFYHFTDIHNAVGIIEREWIYGRAQAQERELMRNDNVSRVVIDMTEDNKKTYGRLYFRPLTPTQYHNEGYKQESIRQSEINANCPVPVFFMLSVERTMSLDRAKFAEKGIAGNHSGISQGVEAFAALNFQKIYHDGSYNTQTDGGIKAFKHAEIIREGGFPLWRLIRGIACRSNAERETLLYLLRKSSSIAYEAYKNRIQYAPLKRMFYNNEMFNGENTFV